MDRKRFIVTCITITIVIRDNAIYITATKSKRFSLRKLQYASSGRQVMDATKEKSAYTNIRSCIILKLKKAMEHRGTFMWRRTWKIYRRPNNSEQHKLISSQQLLPRTPNHSNSYN